MFRIITDSSANITQEEAAQLGITVLPLTIIFDGTEYRDGIDITNGQFYDKLTKDGQFPHTSQLTEEAVASACERALESGGEVLIMPIASALSGSFERAAAVASRYDGVYAEDFCCTTVMLKILVKKAVELTELPVSEAVEILREYRKRIRLYAALDTLEYLKKGGRLSKTSALIGTMLKIKPVITINGKGEVELVARQFGFGKALENVVRTVKNTGVDLSEPVYRIYTMDGTHSELLFEKLGLQCTVADNICPVIGAHIGPCAAGVVYLTEK